MLDTLKADKILAEAKVPKIQREAHIILLREIMTENLATKEDLKNTENRLSEKISNVENRLDDKIDTSENRLNSKIDSVEKRLEEKIDNVKESLQKDMATNFQRGVVHAYAIAVITLGLLVAIMQYIK